MTNREYKIVPYYSDLMPEVVNLLQYLWGRDFNTNVSYFMWKYQENPNTERPPGIVAFYKGQVVGFRGYFATKWYVSETDRRFIVFCPGDTCVHPDHRRKGLSVAIGKFARKEYSRQCKVFLNLSAKRNSVPGYLRMGFVPLSQKIFLNKYNLLGLARHILGRNEKHELFEGNIAFGEFDDIIVFDRPRPEEMHRVISQHHFGEPKIRLVQDRKFFEWRFNNNKGKYIFYYWRRNGVIKGYLVIGVSPNNRRGYILDYAENSSEPLDQILRYVLKMRHFDILSIWNLSLNDSFSRTLRRQGFSMNNLMRVLERKLFGEWPLLVQPAKANYVEDDWFVEGIDLRKIENWMIKSICSDHS